MEEVRDERVEGEVVEEVGVKVVEGAKLAPGERVWPVPEVGLACSQRYEFAAEEFIGGREGVAGAMAH